MNCFCMILLLILFSNQNQCCDRQPRRGSSECSCQKKDTCPKKDVCPPPIRENRCDFSDDIPFLPGGRPFGAFDGNKTCGCEEKPV